MLEPTAALGLFRQLVFRPENGFRDALVAIAGAGDWPMDLLQRLAAFAERVGDLSLDELQELHDETFRPRRRTRSTPGSPAAAPAGRDIADDWRVLSAWLGHVDAPAILSQPPDLVIRALGRLHDELIAARNPYHHVLAALYAFLCRPRRSAGLS